MCGLWPSILCTGVWIGCFLSQKCYDFTQDQHRNKLLIAKARSNLSVALTFYSLSNVYIAPICINAGDLSMSAARGYVPDIFSREFIKKYCPVGNIFRYTPTGAGCVSEVMITSYILPSFSREVSILTLPILIAL